MTDKTVWFGTQERMQWVPAPASAPGVGRSLTKWRTGGQYINGGQWRKESASGSRVCDLQWPVMSGDKVRKISAFLEGSYGEGPFYYSDPFAEGVNSAPQWLAAPWLASENAPRLYQTKPTKVNTPANTYDYPTYGAQYNVAGASTKKVSLPVPEGMTAHIGVHGEPHDVTPGATYTNLALNPSFESTDATIEVWRNLIPNPEAANSLNSWSNLSGASIARVADPTCPEPVPYVAELTCPGAVASEGVWWQATVAAVAIGTVYSGAAWVKAPAGTPLYAGVRISLPTNQSDTEFVATGDWQRVSASRVSTTAGNTDVYFMVRTRYQTAVQFRVGAPVFCAAAAVPAYFSGARSSDPDLTPAWTGAANASASTLSAPPPASAPPLNLMASVWSAQWSASGSRSLRTLSLTSGNDSNRIIVAGSTGSLAGLNVTFVAGQTYTALVKMRLAAPLTGSLSGRALRLLAYANGNMVGQMAGTNTAGVQDLRLTFTVPAGATNAYVMLSGGSSIGNGDVWWDNLCIVEGVYTGPYFDGDTPDVYGTFAWTGAANASTSTAAFSSASVKVNGALVPNLPVTTNQLTNHTVTGPGFLDFTLDGTGKIGLYGVIVRLLPTGDPAPTGPWVKGEGFAGLRLDGDPQITGYSSAQDRQAITASFVETTPWE